MRIWAWAGLAALALAGCGREAERKAPDPLADDPAIAAALADEIMIDPDLVGQNNGLSAVVMTHPTRDVPPEQSGAEAAALARAEAAKLAGGTIRSAPEPEPGKAEELSLTAAYAGCAGKAEHSARWAALLPQPLEVYPHGAVQKAAGTDSNRCALRIVHFVTSVEPGGVIDFYYTRATASGYAARHTLDGESHVLHGKRGGASYLIRAKAGRDGLTAVDLVTAGG